MNCKSFKNIMLEYIENKLNDSLREEASRHLDECRECQRLYSLNRSLSKELGEAFDASTANLSSQRSLILDKIDKSKYGKTPLHTLKTHFKARWARYASAAVAAAMLVSLIPKIPQIVNGVTNLSAAAGKNTQVVPAEQTPLKLRGDGSLKIIGKDKAELEKLVDSKLRNAGPFRTEFLYGDSGKIAFRNNGYLFLYKGDKDSGGIYSAIDMAGYGRGSSLEDHDLSSFISPNGQFYIFTDSDREDVSGCNRVYMLDMLNRESRLLAKEATTQGNILYGSGSYDDLTNPYFSIERTPTSKYTHAWSESSRYFVLADRWEGNMTLYDLSLGKEYKLSIGKKELKRMFISDDGSVFIESTTSGKGYVYSRDNYDKPVEIKLKGKVIGFGKEGIVTTDDLAIYEYTAGSTRKLQDLDKGLKRVQTSLYPNHYYSVFKDGNSLKVYDVLKDKFETFNFKHSAANGYYAFTSDFKYMYLKNNGLAYDEYNKDGRIIDMNGKIEQFRITTEEHDHQVYNDNFPGIVGDKFIVISVNEKSPVPGAIVIKAYDLDGDGKDFSILYDSAKQ